MTMRKLLLPVLAAVAATVLLAGWSSGSTGATASGTLTEAFTTDPANLDPQLTIVNAARTLDAFMYDTLVHLTGPGQVVSGLASSWKVLSPTKVTFTIRKGIKCSDGATMTPSVIKQNLDFVGDPANKSPLLGVFVPPGSTVAANNKTGLVTITTKAPNPFPLQGYGLVQMVCPKGLADRSILTHGADGSGPYTLTEAVPGDHYTLAVRKGYSWGPGGATTASPGQPAKVVVKIISNETTAANLLLTKGLNIATINGNDRARLTKAKLYKKVAPIGPTELFFNEKAGHPAANDAVRRALIQGVNVRQIGGVAASGRGVKAKTMILQELTPCPGDSITGNLPKYNPSAARAVLSSSHPTVKMIYPTDAGASWTAAAELAQQQWSEVGVNVNLVGLTTAALQGALFATGDWDVVLVTIGLPTPASLPALVSGPAPPNGANFGGIQNSAYSGLVASALTKTGLAACKDWVGAESALIKAGDVAAATALTTATYGQGATFALIGEGIPPTSLRLTK
jgi:peptide/nickel transport system substrate-binding protein